MFNKLKSGATQVKRAALEKAGKVQATEESEEFVEKLRSLDATKQTFVNLQKVGKSIYTQHRLAIEKKKVKKCLKHLQLLIFLRKSMYV